MTYETLKAHREGLVEHVTLNRPEVRNAFNPTLIAELSDWAKRAAGSDARVAVLAGEGRVFSAGADLGWMAESARYTHAENVEDAMRMAAMFTALDTLPMPLVARVQGAALGGGVGLVAVCDVVVAEEQATFGFTEVKLGLIPAVISPFVLAKIGAVAARELFLTGARFSAARAREIGLVQAVVPGDEVRAALDRYVADLLEGGPEAVRAAKQLIRQLTAGREPVTRATAEAIAARRVSAEGQEGLHAFLEKRAPKWTTG